MTHEEYLKLPSGTYITVDLIDFCLYIFKKIDDKYGANEYLCLRKTDRNNRYTNYNKIRITSVNYNKSEISVRLSTPKEIKHFDQCYNANKYVPYKSQSLSLIKFY